MRFKICVKKHKCSFSNSAHVMRKIQRNHTNHFEAKPYKCPLHAIVLEFRFDIRFILCRVWCEAESRMSLVYHAHNSSVVIDDTS